MSQKRIQDYGSPIVAKSLKSLVDAITTSGILDGNEFVVDASNRIRINPGSCVTHQGVIIVEDEAKIVTLTGLTSNPADYTIYYLHTDVDISGGVAAELTVEAGLLTADVVEGCILGYVRYSGGGALQQFHFIQPPPLKIGLVTPTPYNAPWIIPIRNHGYVITQTSGGTINITDSTTLPLYIKLSNNGLTTGSVTLTFPFKVSEYPFSLLQMTISTDINASIVPVFIDSSNNAFVLSSFTGQSDLQLKSVEIPDRATTGIPPTPIWPIQTPNSLVYLNLMVSLAASKVAKIQSLGLSTYNSPV